MTKTKIQISTIIFFILSAFLFSCGEPNCENPPKSILSVEQPGSPAYQAALREVIQLDKLDPRYYFEGRVENMDRSYLMVNAYGQGYCGTLMVRVDEETELTKKLQNDSGYDAARLNGFSWSQEEIDGRTEAVLKEIESIQD